MIFGRGAVVIPAFGKTEVTRAVVGDCLREPDVVDVIVVDNAGDLQLEAPQVRVVRPGTNLGWLGGTNYGMRQAQSGPWTWVVALNNDTRLSAGFFSGMRDALAEHPDALVAPCYDDIVETQTRYYRGPVDGFIPCAHDEAVTVIDGTCYAVTSSFLEQLGPLDATHFGRRGWGAIEDYIVRARHLGGGALVTRRSYLHHERGTTAHATMSSYVRYATSEMRRGLRRKHGVDWRRSFPSEGTTKDSLRVRLRDDLRALEDRLGLSETFIGRR